MYRGQPVPTSVHDIKRAKVSDGKSVRVTVPENTEVVANQFYLLDGFLGASTVSVKTEEGETAEVILTIERAEYETDQIDPTQEFTIGTPIYWNEENKCLTETSTEVFAGLVTAPKDANNVIWFLLNGSGAPGGSGGERGPEGPQGPAGEDGFPTEQQWNDLVDRVAALEEN
ncbi:DUF2190 family protein [Halalkalibacter sp. AB-rgal2]|uniref:DUF2190 family protein n=1 Tax=Halalkalibacter sp. AB-rgal2 TaxID=3242695 RepID=UPI00359D0D64